MYKETASEFSENIKRRFARNLKYQREKKNWTQWHLAEITGFSWHTIQKWEQGQTSTSLDKLLWLCKCTGWTMKELIGGNTNAVGTSGRNART